MMQQELRYILHVGTKLVGESARRSSFVIIVC